MNAELPVRQEFHIGIDETVVTSGQLQTLYHTEKDIITQGKGAAYKSRLNGEDVLISGDAATVAVKGKPMEVRLALLRDSGDIVHLLYEPGMAPEDAANSHLLKLAAPHKADGRPPTLFLEGGSLEDNVNNSADFTTARQIAREIKQVKDARVEQSQHKRKAKVQQAKDFFHKNAGWIAKTSAVVVTAGGALFYPAFLPHEDAKLGFVPMPSPIEWFVDWNNYPDHTAQAFKSPKGVPALSSHEKHPVLAVDADYAAAGAPQIKYDEFMKASGGLINETRPGLYQLYLRDDDTLYDANNVATQDSLVGEVRKAAVDCPVSNAGCLKTIMKAISKIRNEADQSCQDVSVRTSDDKVHVFATDPQVAKELTLTMNGKNIQVCSKPGHGMPDRDIYFYQDFKS